MAFSFSRIGSLIGAPTAINGIITQIENAINSVLARTDADNNQMSVTLDMNSNRIINLPAATTGNEAVRFSDVNNILALINGDIPTGGGVIPAAAIGGLAPSATSDTTNASNITSGTLSDSRLPYVVLAGSTEVQINSALQAGLKIVFLPGITYTIAGPIVLQANNIVEAYGATITASVGYSSNYMVKGANNAIWKGGTLDGSHLPSPSGAWLGVGTPVGSIVVADGTSTACDNLIFQDVIFKNSPSGAVFLRQCGAYKFLRTRAINVQTYITNITNAAYEVYGYPTAANAAGGNYGLFEDCTVEGYNWKAWNVGNSIGTKIVRPRASGGTQNTGHAAFEESGSVDTTWISANHVGSGFGFKAFNFLRSTLIDGNFKGSSSAILFQWGTDGKVLGGNYAASSTSNFAIDIEAVAGTGDTNGIYVNGFTARRATLGGGANQTGVHLVANPPYTITDVVVTNSKFDSFYFGHAADNVSGAVYSDIVFQNNEFTNFASYGGIMLASFGDVSNNVYSANNTSAPALAVSMPTGSSAGGVMRVRHNQSFGSTAVATYQIGSTYAGGMVQWQKLQFEGNKATGGATIANLSWTPNATDYINVLEVADNDHVSGTPGSNSLNITFNATTTTLAKVHRNTLLASNGTLNALQYVNAGQISYGSSMDANMASPVYNRPAIMYPFESSGVPAATGFKVGDYIRNTVGTVGQPKGWICTVASTTLVSVGNL